MPVLTQPNTLGDVLKAETDHYMSRKEVTVASGQDLVMGAVVAMISKALAAAPIPVVSGTGNGLMTNLIMGPKAKTGSYVITCKTAVVNGGVFSVVDPDGLALPDLTLTPGAGAATDYVSEQIAFTITDGSTDFIVTDSFTVVVTAGGTPVAIGTGNGVISAISIGPDAELGTYTAICRVAAANGGEFEVISPDGESLGHYILGEGGGNAFENRQINLTITDGSTDFVADDYFNIYVCQGSNLVKEIDFDATDGSQDPEGILMSDVDASLGAVAGVIVYRDAIIDAGYLTWPTGATAGEKEAALAQLEAKGIVTRTVA